MELKGTPHGDDVWLAPRKDAILHIAFLFVYLFIWDF